ncbi:Transglycosylase SLT domain-containing protein [Bryocella elongata]|uniref:Transglycosylase SLT domain-containing protein n=1 Tax=Bryocella elongata TaxID=863522 RepID=A0A1H5S7U9_9BACT|nr:lytic transglycosylase domain-containing protein [Bryocella elongata]SEF46504.1 Transglycosylase SLT domain-containing protein [Bryocella elongata]
MLLLRPSRLAVLALCLASGLSAHALEHVTLANGFSYDCARHENIGDHIRLYFSTSDSFQEIAASSVTAIETLPDPPAAKPETSTPSTQTTTTSIPALLNTVSSAINIDVALLAAVIHAESGGRVRAVSRTGAQGLMQLMPGTASQLGVHDAFRPEENIAAGTAYLDSLLKRYDPRDDAHGLALALAAYNAGPAAVDRYHGIPPYRETRAYVARVMNEYKRRASAAPAVASAHAPQPAH